MRKNQEEWITAFNEKHNYFYDYSKTDLSNRDKDRKVIIICPIHGEFYQTPSNHLQGKGCYFCKGNLPITREQFIEKAKVIHGDKYDYSKVEYVNYHTKVCIICPTHGEFYQTPTNHINKNNPTKCPFCGHRGYKYTHEEWVNKAKETHNNKYQYPKFDYKNKEQLVDIICPIHGEFKQIANSHLHGCGCPFCRESKLEIEIKEILVKHHIQFEQQKRFKWLGRQSLDFYIPTINIAIECQGEQHYQSVDFAGKGKQWADKNHMKIKKLDNKKQALCEEHNVKIIYYSKEKYNENIFTDNVELLKQIIS